MLTLFINENDDADDDDDEDADDDDVVLFHCVCVCTDEVDVHYRSFSHNCAIEAVMSVLRDANSLVQTHQPWLLAKSSDADDQSALECVLHVGLESARVAALALSPVTPSLSQRILDRLGCQPGECGRQHMLKPLVGARRLGVDSGPLFARVKPPLTPSLVPPQRSSNSAVV